MHMECWEAIVDGWRTPEAYETRRKKSGYAKGKVGPSHHQGSRSLGEYMDTWVPFTLICLFIHLLSHSFSLRVIILVFSSQTQSHDDQVINEFTGYILSHQGKAIDSENVYDLARGPDAITNQNVYDKVVQYIKVVRTCHGADYDPSTEPLDMDILMRMGGGKQHDKYFIAHSVIDPAIVPSLREVRHSGSSVGTSSDVPIQPRRPSSTQMMAVVQVTIRHSLVLHMLPNPYALFKHRLCNIAGPAGRDAGPTRGPTGKRGGPRRGPSAVAGGPTGGPSAGDASFPAALPASDDGVRLVDFQLLSGPGDP
jgi:hypothetical protein